MVCSSPNLNPLPPPQRWLDVTMRNLTADWLDRIEERFVGGDQRPRVLQRRAQLDAPQTFLEQFFAQYPAAMTQRVQSCEALKLFRRARGPAHPIPSFIPHLHPNPPARLFAPPSQRISNHALPPTHTHAYAIAHSLHLRLNPSPPLHTHTIWEVPYRPRLPTGSTLSTSAAARPRSPCRSS